jgi:hypothetical protein
MQAIDNDSKGLTGNDYLENRDIGKNLYDDLLKIIAKEEAAYMPLSSGIEKYFELYGGRSENTTSKQEEYNRLFTNAKADIEQLYNNFLSAKTPEE